MSAAVTTNDIGGNGDRIDVPFGSNKIYLIQRLFNQSISSVHLFYLFIQFT